MCCYVLPGKVLLYNTGAITLGLTTLVLLCFLRISLMVVHTYDLEIPALAGKVEAILSYIARPCLQDPKGKKKKEII